MGTTVLRLDVASASPASAAALPYENVYTGAPLTPGCKVFSSQMIPLTEGTDFTVGYNNNVLCGIADLLVYPAGEDGREILANFMIVPGKAAISGMTAVDGEIRVTVADQWATEIGGYEIEYRKEGENKWQTVTLTDGQTEAVLPEAETGAVYEMRARAMVDGINGLVGGSAVFFGEYSDTVTITVP